MDTGASIRRSTSTHPLRWSARSGSTSHSGLHSTKTIARDIEPSRNNGASK